MSFQYACPISAGLVPTAHSRQSPSCGGKWGAGPSVSKLQLCSPTCCAGVVTYNPRGMRGSSESALAGRVNPVPPICELGGPRTREVRKETEEKKGDVKERMKEKAKNKGLGNSRPEQVSRWESRAGESGAHALPHSAILFPGDEQENEVLSRSRLQGADHSPLDWPNPPLHTPSLHPPLPLSTPAGTAVVLLEHTGAASPELQLKWFSKESTHGNPNQLFPSSRQ